MAVFCYLSGAWRTTVAFDQWDPSAGVWRDVKEFWGFSAGAWRLLYRRAKIEALTVETTPGDPFPSYATSFTVNGTAAGTVFYELRINGTILSSGFIATPGSRVVGVLGVTEGSDTGDLRIYNIRGRLIETQPLPL